MTGALMNIPLLPVFVKIAQIPPGTMATITVAILAIGAYSINGNPFDVAVMIGAGLVGYLLRKLGIPPAPLVLAFILGPIFETNFRRSLVLSDGDITVFASSAVSVGLLVLLVLMVVWAAISLVMRSRRPTRADVAARR
ncbi:hypothetical protein E1262_14385 [Jiangella aurantiaca]|uniref:DUF112 domain-containing protein n=1 Tax=Jiangella aurantiaca TaxID=2530373 RepID=A0A4V2YSB3_9ACTN|nr:tripartite tricarboxylate transporter permease [Jiangella aurantiaca]TDD68927.1 hypothetical protein E1262_14385 [Jiangella aurantiaca]